MIITDAVEKQFNVCVDSVVALDGDAATATFRDLLGGLVNRAPARYPWSVGRSTLRPVT